jgi:site-specific DNA-cytosine methylase
VPIAAFDNNEVVRGLWEAGHEGRPCWGDFYLVREYAAAGKLDAYMKQVLIYTAGTPCPDWSAAGLQRGVKGRAGGRLWLQNVGFIVEQGFPVAVLEQVPGILDVDGGWHLFEAIRRLREGGYDVAWRIVRCNRHGDATSRRRVFVVAAKPNVLREGGSVHDMLPEDPGLTKARVGDVVEDEPEGHLYYDGPVDWDLPRPDEEEYDGPILMGTVLGGGIGKHVYSAEGPAITQKTWGEGPGESTGLYYFPESGRVRKLSARESMRVQSFPSHMIERALSSYSEEECYRLAGNSIPVNTMREILKGILSGVDPKQVPEVS